LRLILKHITILAEVRILSMYRNLTLNWDKASYRKYFNF
jgi:hypothetical protein